MSNDPQGTNLLKIALLVGAVGYVAYLNGVALPFIPSPTPTPAPVADTLEANAEAAWRATSIKVGNAWIETADAIKAGDLSGTEIFDSLQESIFGSLANGMDPITDKLPEEDDEKIAKSLRAVGMGIKKVGGK